MVQFPLFPTVSLLKVTHSLQYLNYEISSLDDWFTKSNHLLDKFVYVYVLCNTSCFSYC